MHDLSWCTTCAPYTIFGWQSLAAKPFTIGVEGQSALENRAR
jgi:hypothetical protein